MVGLTLEELRRLPTGAVVSTARSGRFTKLPDRGLRAVIDERWRDEDGRTYKDRIVARLGASL